ncbi:MAG: 23S rRNA (pseudouridine(1915)-N(3))-methyltransferase RlmH [Bacteroidales bacterium]|nr:23S rRNA (pseudouridine(1915)-N(3))-methyltransferase RlmH [Bacteroidales bacterium]
MKITLLTVGKTDKDWVRQGMDIYVSRLKHYIPFSVVEIPELKNVSSLSKDQIKTREGELILKNIRPTDDLILLDERGKEYTSVELAKVIQDKISYAGKDMVYVIGGAYGFSEEVYRRADSKISLSRMTFSHQMVRAIFVEQIYRAFTIMRGEPYHHE